MSRARAITVAIITAAAVVAAGAVWWSRQPDADLVLETADGVTFLRQRAATEGDDVAHTGRLFVADDGCLYVTPDDDGQTYLVAVGPGTAVSSDEVRLRWGVVRLGSSATFGRANIDGTLPEWRSKCTLAQEAYGVG